jgi:nicotinic acid mononucleotide adenylyltransferase
MARDGLGVPDISSTDIRARLRDGRGATALVSAGVRPLAERVWGPP